MAFRYWAFVPGYQMLTNTDLTIFHRVHDPVTRLDKWERTYVDAAWWFKDSKATLNTDGLTVADVYYVRIPDTLLVICKDDYLVKGDCSVDMQTVKDLEGYEKTRATTVNINTFGDNPHIKVVGV